MLTKTLSVSTTKVEVLQANPNRLSVHIKILSTGGYCFIYFEDQDTPVDRFIAGDSFDLTILDGYFGRIFAADSAANAAGYITETSK